MKIIILYLFAILFISCKVSSGSYEEKRNISDLRTLDTIKREIQSQTVSDSLLKKLSFSLKAVVTKFAPVDSTGKQYIESISEYDLTGQQVTENNTVTNKSIETDQKLQEINSINEDIQIDETTKTDNRILRPYSWWWIPLTVILLGVIFYRLRKRFKLYCSN